MKWLAGSGMIIALALAVHDGVAADKAPVSLRICFVEDASSFTYLRDGEIHGLHGELIRDALQALNMRSEWVPLPWARCLVEAEQGRVDALASASYSLERENYLFYPDDAKTNPASHWAVAHTSDVVVTHRDQGYEYGGDPHTIPAPVRVPRGWAVADYLAGMGVPVDEVSPSDESNLRRLQRDAIGSVVAIADSAQLYLAEHDPERSLRISAQPLRHKSYFFPFTLTTRLTAPQRRAVWDSIAKLRSDADYMRALRARQ